jgi:hypothetical protein
LVHRHGRGAAGLRVTVTRSQPLPVTSDRRVGGRRVGPGSRPCHGPPPARRPLRQCAASLSGSAGGARWYCHVAAPGRASRGSLRTRTLLPAFKFRDGRHTTTEPRSRPPALRRLSLAAARRSQPPGPSAAVRRRSLGRQALKSQGQLQVGYRRARASAGAVRGHIQPAASLRVSARLDSDGPASGWQRLLNAGHESLALHAGADRGRARGYYHSRPTRDCRTPRGRAAPASKSPLSDGPRPGPGRAGTNRASKFVDTVARRSAAGPNRGSRRRRRLSRIQRARGPGLPSPS